MRQCLPENDGKSDYHIGCGQGWVVRVVNAGLDCVADGICWLNGEGLFDASRFLQLCDQVGLAVYYSSWRNFVENICIYVITSIL